MESHQKPQKVVVLIVPLSIQSHLNQLPHFPVLLSSQNSLPVHYLSFATHNRQVTLCALNSLNPNLLSQIHFHNLPTSPITSPDPDRNSSDKHPSNIAPFTIAYLELHHPIAIIVRDLSLKKRRIIVIYDQFIVEVVRVIVTFPKDESYTFNCLSTFNLFLK